MKRSNPNRPGLLAGSLVFTLAAGLAQPAHAAPLDISQNPLFLTARVQPAFIMAIDDSGSMRYEQMIPGDDIAGSRWTEATAQWNGFFDAAGNYQTGTDAAFNAYNFAMPTGGPVPFRFGYHPAGIIPLIDNFGFVRSPEINYQYFDPSQSYVPWKRHDGTSWPNANPAAVSSDPRNVAAAVLDFTQDQALQERQWRYNLAVGMRLPAGTQYYYRYYNTTDPGLGNGGQNPDPAQMANGCGGLGMTPGTRNTWVTLASELTISSVNAQNGICKANLRQFLPTYYLYEDTPVPAGFRPEARVLAEHAGGPGVHMYRYEIRPANYTSPAAFAAAQQNFANWYQYYGNRNRAMVASMTLAFDPIEFLRVGYFEISDRPARDGNNLVMRDLAVAADREALYADMTALPIRSNTPNRSAVSRMGEQFTRDDVDAPVQLACQLNAGLLFTDGYTNELTGNPPMQVQDLARNYGDVDGGLDPPFGGNPNPNTLADIAAYYYLNNLRPDLESGRVPVPAGCGGASPDPRLNCQSNPHMSFYGITLGTPGEIYGVDEQMTENPYAPPFPNWSVTGTTNRSPKNVDDIWHATLTTRGGFYATNNPTDVTDAIRDVLSTILDATSPSGSMSLTGARIGEDSFSVVPSFEVANDGHDWSGRVRAYEVNTDGSLGALRWDTNNGALPAHPFRNIVTVTTPGPNLTKVAANFNAAAVGDWPSLGLTQQWVTDNLDGATLEQVVDYLRGDTTREERNGGPFRDRTTLIGDIVNSSPRIVSPKDDYGYRLLQGVEGGTAYTDFLSTKAGNAPMVYVGANAGMMHAFDGDNGQERFAFVPNAMLGDRRDENGIPLQMNLGRLADPRYEHSYFVDGALTIADAYVGGWKQVLVGSAGAGGRSVFALDVTLPGGFNAGHVMWEVNSRTNNDIGFVLGDPLILPVNGNRWMALFGNGYNSDNDRAALFMVDLATGDVTTIPAGPDGQNNGLGGIIAIDETGDGRADTVYGGDLLGNLWKFNLAGPGSVANGGNPLFVARDAGGARQPITGGLDVSAGPGGGRMVYFGTGRYFAVGDNVVGEDPQVQTFYGIWDNGTPVGGRADLQQQQITSESATPNPSRQTSASAVNYATQRGWFMDLKVGSEDARGERFVGTPRLQSGQVFFTTFEPTGDPCIAGGVNWLYGLTALSGAAGLRNVTIGSVDGDPACDGENCGALGIAAGPPVRETVLSIPPPGMIPGLHCIVGEPGCEVPENFEDVYARCTLVVQAAGSPPLYMPRPCGRQSWRQIR